MNILKLSKPQITYINRYNFDILKKYWFFSGSISTILLVFMLSATGAFGILGFLIVFFVANITIVIRGFQQGIWKPYGKGVNTDEIESKRSNRNK